MAHIQQQEFVVLLRSKFPKYFKGTTVLEWGSLDTNGNVSFLFSNSKYLGVDVQEGENVDLVSAMNNININEDTLKWIRGDTKLIEGQPTKNTTFDILDLKSKFDVVYSCEMLQHDFFYKDSLKKMYTILKPGGLLFFTCGGYNRQREYVPLEWQNNEKFTKKNYCENITTHQFTKMFDLELLFCDFSIEYNGSGTTGGDLYFWGIKR